MDRAVAKKILWASILISLVIVGLFLAYAYWASKTESESEIAELRAAEQKRLGIDCSTAKVKVSRLMARKIKPIVEQGRAGKRWIDLIDQALIDELSRYDKLLLRCWLIYELGDTAGNATSREFHGMNRSILLMKGWFQWLLFKERSQSSVAEVFTQVVEEYDKLTGVVAPSN
ncbi:MAG: hypothetical protein V3T23_01305 [Nitrososphaerales archaeon]